MFDIPEYFPTANESWSDSTQQNALFYDADDLIRESNIAVLCNASGRYKNTLTTANPFTHTLYAMLAHENYNPTAQKKTLRIDFESLPLDERQLVHCNTTPVPLADTGSPRTNFKIKIYKVTKGSSFMDRFDNQAELKAVSLHLQRSSQHKIRVYKHNEHEISVYTNIWAWEIYYKIAGLVSNMFPLLWPKMSPEVQAYALALTELDRTKLITATTTWMNKTNFLHAKKLKAVQEWVQSTKRKRLENISYQLRQANDNIRNYEQSLKNAYDSRNGYSNELYALENNPDETNKANELMEYITTNKALQDFQIENNNMKLYIYAPLKYVDTAMVEHNYIKRASVQESNPNLVKLFKAAYIDETIELWTMTVITLNLSGADAFGGEANIPSAITAKYALHPHINRYSCFGNNRNLIIKGLKSNDIIMAIEQCIAAGMNLNFSDSAVITRLASDLNSRTRNIATFIKNVETGEFITYADFCRKEEPEPTPVTEVFEEVGE